MRWALECVVIVLATGGSGYADARAGGEKAIEVDGRARRYLVHEPAEGTAPRPLVIVLHGGGGSAQQAERGSDFDEVADRNGFVVVYPDSLGGYWNDGRGVSFMRAQRDNIDDVKFIRAMVDQIAQENKIDRRRVFATGLSNGGLMSHRLAAEASDMIAAIAPVAGGMAPSIAEAFNPRQPVSILIIQGEADPVVPIDGGDIVGRDSTRGKVIAT